MPVRGCSRRQPRSGHWESEYLKDWVTATASDSPGLVSDTVGWAPCPEGVIAPPLYPTGAPQPGQAIIILVTGAPHSTHVRELIGASLMPTRFLESGRLRQIDVLDTTVSFQNDMLTIINVNFVPFITQLSIAYPLP